MAVHKLGTLVRHGRSKRLARIVRERDLKVMVEPFDRPGTLEWWQFGDFSEEIPQRPFRKTETASVS